MVPVGPEVVEAVDDYLLSRSPSASAPTPLPTSFVRSDGRPFTRGTLDYLVSHVREPDALIVDQGGLDEDAIGSAFGALAVVSEPGGEPAHDVEPAQDMGGVAQVAASGC